MKFVPHSLQIHGTVMITCPTSREDVTADYNWHDIKIRAIVCT